MILKTQIIGLLFSLIYGFLFSLFISVNSKYIYSSKKIVKIISSILVVVIGVLSYFIFLKNIIDGSFHIYFVFSLLIGAYFENLLSNKVANK